MMGDSIATWGQVHMKMIVVKLIIFGGQDEVSDASQDQLPRELVEESPLRGAETIGLIDLPIGHDPMFPIPQHIVFDAIYLGQAADVDGGRKAVLADDQFVDGRVANGATVIGPHVHDRIDP